MVVVDRSAEIARTSVTLDSLPSSSASMPKCPLKEKVIVHEGAVILHGHKRAV